MKNMRKRSKRRLAAQDAPHLVRDGLSGRHSTKPAPCNCWHEKDNGCRKQGYKISDACAMLELVKETLSLKACFGLLLQRTDGKPLRRDDPRMITISHCPCCGSKL